MLTMDVSLMRDRYWPINGGSTIFPVCGRITEKNACVLLSPRICDLPLPLLDRLNTRAENLCNIGALIDAEPDHAGCEYIDGVTKVRHAEINEHQRDQDRRAAKQLGIEPGKAWRTPGSEGPQDGRQQPDERAAHNGRYRKNERCQQALEQDWKAGHQQV